MKQKYIFLSVIPICLLMFVVLPRLAMGAHAAAPAAVNPAVMKAAVSGALPTTPTLVPAPAKKSATAKQPAAKELPAAKAQAIVQPTAVAQPAAADASIPFQPPPGASSADVPLTADVPSLTSFAASVTNGQAGLLTGVYAPDLFAVPVLQQPAEDGNFIAVEDNSMTQYGRPETYGVTGLLAHNTLTGGQDMARLKPGQEVILIYGDGSQSHFKVDHVENYQALSPNDTHSDFVDLNKSGGEVINHQQLFDRVYTTSGAVVFQTCIEANGDPSWGRMFVIAKPA